MILKVIAGLLMNNPIRSLSPAFSAIPTSSSAKKGAAGTTNLGNIQICDSLPAPDSPIQLTVQPEKISGQEKRPENGISGRIANHL